MTEPQTIRELRFWANLVVSSAYPRETRIVEVMPAPRGDAE